MSTDLDADLLGVLDADAIAELRGLLATVLPPVAPDPSVRARVMADCASGRLHQHAARLAELFALDEGAARALLDRADDAAEWFPFPVPGVRILPVVPGAVFAHRTNWLIRVAAGTHFPAHQHGGIETTLVLQGTLRDDDGTVYHAGDVSARPPASAHAFVAEGTIDLLCGLAFEGVIRPI